MKLEQITDKEYQETNGHLPRKGSTAIRGTQNDISVVVVLQVDLWENDKPIVKEILQSYWNKKQREASKN